MAAQRVVIATDSFKGSIGADAAGLALAEGWHSVHPADEVVCLPMADGGEGTLDAVARAVPTARRMPVTVRGPEGVPVEAGWLWLPPTAGLPAGTGLVELANTSGIELLEGRLRPLDADTLGLGQAIAAALESGVSRLVIGLGSSASTDGGAGALVALGAKFMDAGAHPIAPGGRGLHALTAVDLSALAPLPPGGVTILTDVPNPLLGPGGAAAVFGPQKGATPADVAMLDAGLA
ncbi:MAG TPA: glycerate kinase, partial [Microbacteriaceae bacterium]|nr:glycerate kinase [Microbacteriaceae bacterium]